MDKFTFAKRVIAWTSVIAAIIVAVWNIFNWNVVEETVFAEIAKIVFVGLGCVFIANCLVIWPALTIYDHKHRNDEE